MVHHPHLKVEEVFIEAISEGSSFKYPRPSTLESLFFEDNLRDRVFGCVRDGKVHLCGSGISEESRRLHAKLIEIVCRHGRLLLSGSVNATAPALTETNNVEVGVLRILKATDPFGWRATKRPKGPGVGGPMP